MATIVSAYRRGVRLALLFDYDGTLTPIVDNPARARLEPPTLRLLKQLALHPRVSVGIISGRSLDDLQGLVDVPGLYSAGTSGLELDLQGVRLTLPAAEPYRILLQEVAGQLGRLTGAYPGAWVEYKGLGLTLHYRSVARHQCRALLEEADRKLGPYADRLQNVQGAMAWEITPAVPWNKGSALRLILESIGPPVVPVYAGDGANGEEAIAATIDLGGVALGIGAEAPASVHLRLRDPADLVSFLGCLEEALAEGRAAEMIEWLSRTSSRLALKTAAG
jgi:trehalose-phosphatase